VRQHLACCRCCSFCWAEEGLAGGGCVVLQALLLWVWPWVQARVQACSQAGWAGWEPACHCWCCGWRIEPNKAYAVSGAAGAWRGTVQRPGARGRRSSGERSAVREYSVDRVAPARNDQAGGSGHARR
jgi:hypothetical protein